MGILAQTISCLRGFYANAEFETTFSGLEKHVVGTESVYMNIVEAWYTDGTKSKKFTLFGTSTCPKTRSGLKKSAFRNCNMNTGEGVAKIVDEIAGDFSRPVTKIKIITHVLEVGFPNRTTANAIEKEYKTGVRKVKL
jgi:hypothetical protein